MLMRYIEVSKEGEFSMKGDPRILYATMMDIRIYFMFMTGVLLSHASLIALRYSAVRR